MKKLILLLTLILIFISCDRSKSKKAEQIKNQIISELPEQLKYIESARRDFKFDENLDKFYFIQGWDYDGSISTNIKYRGLLYSKRLEKYGYPEGVEVDLDKLRADESILYEIATSYIATLKQVEIDSMVENKAREIFGPKINLYNDWSMTKEKYENIKGMMGKKNITYDEKNGAYSTIVNVFVDNLDKLDNEDIKRKTFELAKFIYDDMNYVTALQVYVRDDKYFEDINLIYPYTFTPFDEREDIKAIINKIENNEKLNEEEKISLIKVFNKGGLDYEKCHYKAYRIRFKEQEEFPLVLENVNYESEIKNSNEIYLNWRDGEK